MESRIITYLHSGQKCAHTQITQKIVQLETHFCVLICDVIILIELAHSYTTLRALVWNSCKMTPR